MLNILKSNSIPSLEKQLADKQAKLAHLRGQYGEGRLRVDDLGDHVSSALVDGHANLDSLETQLLSAESRLRTTGAAIAKVESEVVQLEQQLASARDKAAREASADVCRELAKALLKAKPAAAKASAEIAEIIGRCPEKAHGYFPAVVQQALAHFVPASGFYAGDFLDMTAAQLEIHAGEILAGQRPHDLGVTIDARTESYGGPPFAAKKVA